MNNLEQNKRVLVQKMSELRKFSEQNFVFSTDYILVAIVCLFFVVFFQVQSGEA